MKLKSIIEINKKSRLKYEYDNNIRRVKVDRLLNLGTLYPINYGFIPRTIAGDRDEIDCMLYIDSDIVNNALIETKILGSIIMEDECGIDKKILLIPENKISKEIKKKNYTDMSKNIINNIEFFFSRYKDLECKKWIKIYKWKNFIYTIKLLKDSKKKYYNSLKDLLRLSINGEYK